MLSHPFVGAIVVADVLLGLEPTTAAAATCMGVMMGASWPRSLHSRLLTVAIEN